MARGNSFVVNDSEIAENIEKRFHEYVALFIKLHYPEGNAVSDAERRELTLKLKELVNEITLLGLKHKRIKSDAEWMKHLNQQTSSAAEPRYLPACN